MGSATIIAVKADGAENVIRVKAAIRNFKVETNFSVITEEGSLYTFNVKYADEPILMSVEMKDFIHDGDAVSHPNNVLEVYPPFTVTYKILHPMFGIWLCLCMLGRSRPPEV